MPAEVSIYAHAKTSRSSGVSPFADVLQRISSGEFEGRISHLRSMPPDDYKREKLNLPMFTTSGGFIPSIARSRGFSGTAVLRCWTSTASTISKASSQALVPSLSQRRRSGRRAGRGSRWWWLFVLFLKPPTITRRRSTAPYRYSKRTCPSRWIARAATCLARVLLARCAPVHQSPADPVMWCRDAVLGAALDYIDGTDRDDWLKVTMGCIV